jgi:hypothetical protein
MPPPIRLYLFAQTSSSKEPSTEKVTLYHAIGNQLLSPPREATIKERLQHAHSVGTVSSKVRPFMKALARAFTMTDEACRSPRESMERVSVVRSHPAMILAIWSRVWIGWWASLPAPK